MTGIRDSYPYLALLWVEGGEGDVTYRTRLLKVVTVAVVMTSTLMKVVVLELVMMMTMMIMMMMMMMMMKVNGVVVY